MSSLILVVEFERGGCYQELPIDVRAGEWPLVQITESGVLCVHPEPEGERFREFLTTAVQREARRTKLVMWIFWTRWPATSTRVEADAIYHDAESPLARVDAMIEALLSERH